MRRPFRSALVAGCALALVFGAAAHAQPSASGPQKRDGVWAQDYSDLKPDPAVRFGTLPNGMRYAIMHNATPTKQASLRLYIGSGSLEEHDDQQGLAHFLEHMAFKGSKSFPDGPIKVLERHGLAFGPDTNASTFWDNTTFMLDLPQTDEDTVDTGLSLLREDAGELTLSQAAMDPERGVVLSEERLRDSPGYRQLVDWIRFVLQGQLAGRRVPIGKVDVIQHAPVSLIRRFYEANYRPENAVFVAVGDFDVDAMERKIKARFSDWRAKAPAQPRPDLGPVLKRGPEVRLFSETGAPESVEIAWAEPYDAAADTAARERRDMIERLALQVLNRRYERLAQGEHPPFVGAGVRRDNWLKSAKLTQIEVRPQPGRWREAMEAALLGQRRIVQYGVRQDELDREIAELRTQLTTAAAGAATRRTPTLANAIVENADEDEVFTSPAEDLALFEGAVKGLTAAQVSATLKTLFAGSGPLVMVSSPTPVEGGEGAVRTALQSVESQPVAPPTVEAAKAWPYASFGPAGRVAARRDIADLGVTEMTFANGVRLTVKPTRFTRDQILVNVRFGEGRLGEPKALADAAWATNAFHLGGTRELTYEEIQQILASKLASASLSIGDDAFNLSGATRPADLDVQMQLLAAYMTRPGFRPQAFDRIKGLLATQLPALQAQPLAVLQLNVPQVLHGDDPRWRPLPTAAQLPAAQPQNLPALVGPALTSGAVEVTVVGDVTPEQAIAAVASTFGALPTRPAPRLRTSDAIRFPAPDAAAPETLIHQGRPDQAVAYEAWPTTDLFADPQQARVLEVLAEVLKSRVTDQVRIAEGATYSPSASSTSDDVLKGFGYVDTFVETPPGKIDNFYGDVAKIVADLRERPPTADEMERAKKPLIEQVTKARQTNGYWFGHISRAQTDPRTLDLIRDGLPGLQRVSAADVQAAARTYLVDERRFRLVVRAANPAPGAPNQTPITPRPAPPRAPQPTAPAVPSSAAPASPSTSPPAASQSGSPPAAPQR